MVSWLVISLAAVGLVWWETYHSTDLARQLSALDGKSDNLLRGNEGLKRQLADYQALVTNKDSEIDTLKDGLKRAKRGQTTSWDFNGMKRMASGSGQLNLETETPETKVFVQITTLHDQHSWGELDRICSEQIEKNPEWLTPLMFRGVARANLGRISEARADLEIVVREVGDSGDYAQSKALLNKLPAK